MRISVKGLKSVEAQMRRIARGVKAMSSNKAVVFSRLPYAYGAEYGRHRRGKLARRFGGAFYMRGAIDEVLASADHDLSTGLNKVSAPGVWVLRRLGFWTRRVARKKAPRRRRGQKKSHNYRLYRSIRSEVRAK